MKICIPLFYLILLCDAASAAAQDRQIQRSLAGTCFSCHGTDGRSVGGVPPGLAGLSKSYLLQQMKAYKAAKRPATIMHQIATGYTGEQLELIADYFASVKPGPATPAPRAGY